ncbi:hypothetical protein A1O3_05177 [Capronia epimyces CBS 606.96]|uniref:Uncharacterized protein n=1 Tax=Capronia epimyces CBS 606.96 TaxID=1182542 RepID=W9XWA7_9EURO|nr:uncharacterized protein A1O3_05177 [Capronia epimyces CBS 606.96]EXJ84508.1 hypothetical protein A1O3_05177 [Capronia epimyces CBS 606.96]
MENSIANRNVTRICGLIVLNRPAPEPTPVSKGLPPPLPPEPEPCDPDVPLEDAAEDVLELDDDDEEEDEEAVAEDEEEIEVVKVFDVAEAIDMAINDEVDSDALLLLADSVLLAEAADWLSVDSVCEVAVTILEETAAEDSAELAAVVVATPLLFEHR